jgi:hypothetical protein
MMSAMEFTSTFNARRTPAALKLSAYTAAVVAKLKDLAPYALIELVLPGGSVMALLLWLYRRQRKVAAFATHRLLLFYSFGVNPMSRRNRAVTI